MSDRHKKHGKKRKKSYYIKCAHKKPKRENDLGEDMKGFLVTCNSNEKQAVREMYNLLNEYADKIYGPEEFQDKSIAEKEENESETDEEEDLDKAMEKEIEAMKSTKPTQRRFQNVDTKAKNCIFIKTLVEDPCSIMYNIFSDLAETGIRKTRYAIRALPIQGTCKAHISDIEKLAKSLFKADFETPFGTGLKFSIIYKSRNNHGIGRISVIPALAQIICDMNPLHKVDHDDPDFVVLVEIVGTVCCLSVLKDFHKFRKYNLHEVTKPKSDQTEVKDENCKGKSLGKTDTEENNDNVNEGDENSAMENDVTDTVISVDNVTDTCPGTNVNNDATDRVTDTDVDNVTDTSNSVDKSAIEIKTVAVVNPEENADVSTCRDDVNLEPNIIDSQSLDGKSEKKDICEFESSDIVSRQKPESIVAVAETGKETFQTVGPDHIDKRSEEKVETVTVPESNQASSGCDNVCQLEDDQKKEEI